MNSAGAIFLLGLPGVGKSTAGALLAERLRQPFIDLDKLIEAQAGLSVAQIFAAEGEAGFRERESAALRHAAASAGPVVATGGGAPLRAANVEVMRAAGVLVLLTADTETLVARLDAPEARRGRPLLGEAGALAERIAALGAQRAAAYAESDVVVDTRGRTPAQVAEQILLGVNQAMRRERP